MQILVNTDNYIAGGEELTRVEVHLTDENSISKSGDTDKRCVMEVRSADYQPIRTRLWSRQS